jgi:hypothetical protein
LSQTFKNFGVQEINFFKFKILILPDIELCCPGKPYHSPNPSYAPDGSSSIIITTTTQ